VLARQATAAVGVRTWWPWETAATVLRCRLLGRGRAPRSIDDADCWRHHGRLPELTTSRYKNASKQTGKKSTAEVGTGSEAITLDGRAQHGMKKPLREMQTLRAGCGKAEPKIFAPPQAPFPGARDGQHLISWRWSLPLPRNPVWWGSMHAISSYRGNRPKPPARPPARPLQTHKQDRLQYTVPLSFACSVVKTRYGRHLALWTSVQLGKRVVDKAAAAATVTAVEASPESELIVVD